MALVYRLAVTALPVLGCSAHPSEATNATVSIGTPDQENVGKIALALAPPGGPAIGSVAYTMTNGTPANAVAGTYTFPAGADSSSLVISGIPLGTGYEVSLLCTSVDGTVTCSGTGPAATPASDASSGFDVTPGTLTIVNVLLTCTLTADAGEP
jgi:hypothetical protein